jgi:Protein of unknown function (DUF3435)
MAAVNFLHLLCREMANGKFRSSQRCPAKPDYETQTIQVFLDHYLPRRITTEIQAVMRGLEPDSEMMRAITRMGRWIDTRRPRELTLEQKASIEQKPELVEAIRKRDALHVL